MKNALKSVASILVIALLAACGSTPTSISDGLPAFERPLVSAPTMPDGVTSDSSATVPSVTLQTGYWYSRSYPRAFGDTYQARYNDAIYMTNRTANLNNTWCTLYNFDMPWW